MVHFVGAGCGAKDLITVRGARLLKEADCVLYAGSLVNPALLDGCKPGCRIFNTAKMTLEEVVSEMARAEAQGLSCVRLHTGDPSLYGAVREQMDALERLKIPYDVTPGVSSFCGAAAALHAEYTLPGVSQTVILTRVPGRTAVPEGESLSSLAAHRCSMVLFLSAGLAEDAQRELLNGGLSPETPAAVVCRATFPDEQIVRCTVGTLAEAVADAGIRRTALLLIGEFLNGSGERSKLYDPSFSTGFREGTP